MKKRYIEEYIQFTLHVNQTLSDTWNKRLMYAVGISLDTWQFWEFAPGEKPELLKVLQS